MNQAKVISRADPNEDGVWVNLPEDFETGRVPKSPSVWDRLAELFGPDHVGVALRRTQQGLKTDFESVESWRASLV